MNAAQLHLRHGIAVSLWRLRSLFLCTSVQPCCLNAAKSCPFGPDNPYDSQAIAIKARGEMLGYVPAEMNATLSVLFHYGHAPIFECRVMQVAPENDPWKQLRVAIYVKDAR